MEANMRALSICGRYTKIDRMRGKKSKEGKNSNLFKDSKPPNPKIMILIRIWELL